MNPNAPLPCLTGHLVEGVAWSKKNKPTTPGWAAYRGPDCDPFMLQVIKDATGLWAQWFTVKGKVASRNIETMNGEWCPIPTPTDAPAQRYYRAEEVEALLDKHNGNISKLKCWPVPLPRHPVGIKKASLSQRAGETMTTKLTRMRPKGSGVSSKMGARFAKLLAQGIMRDSTKLRTDGHIGKAIVSLPKALQVSKNLVQ